MFGVVRSGVLAFGVFRMFGVFHYLILLCLVCSFWFGVAWRGVVACRVFRLFRVFSVFLPFDYHSVLLCAESSLCSVWCVSGCGLSVCSVCSVWCVRCVLVGVFGVFGVLVLVSGCVSVFSVWCVCMFSVFFVYTVLCCHGMVRFLP